MPNKYSPTYHDNKKHYYKDIKKEKKNIIKI